MFHWVLNKPLKLLLTFVGHKSTSLLFREIQNQFEFFTLLKLSSSTK